MEIGNASFYLFREIQIINFLSVRIIIILILILILPIYILRPVQLRNYQRHLWHQRENRFLLYRPRKINVGVADYFVKHGNNILQWEICHVHFLLCCSAVHSERRS